MNLKEIQDDIFVSEDISKPENRINLAIFNLQIYNPFHNWFFKKLNLNPNGIIYPTKNSEGNRPDYIIRLNDKIIGYIEVECGDDPEQINRFKSIFEKNERKVYSILGKKEYKGDLSLEEISIFLKNEISNVKNPQTIVSIIYLIKLIKISIENKALNKRANVSDKMLRNPFVSKLLNLLKNIDKVQERSKPVPGYIYYDTVSEGGFSLKIYSPIGSKKQISLFNISGGRDYINFQSEDKYREYLKDREENVLQEWISFIKLRLNLRIGKIERNKKTSTSINVVFNNIDEMCEIIKKLA